MAAGAVRIPPPVSESAYIGLGSNLRQPQRQVLGALEALSELPRTQLQRQSPLYHSPPLGVPGQPDYVNAAALLETALQPLELLDQLQCIEHEMGRRRDGERWGPRVIDLDLLLYGEQRMDHPRLQLPHPELHKRAFVLIPLADIAPTGLEIPGQGSLQALLANSDRRGVMPIA